MSTLSISPEIPNTSALAGDMIWLARQRREKYNLEVVGELPDYQLSNEKVFIGQFSQTTTRTANRFLLRDASQHYLCEIPQSPTEIARDYLDVVFPKPLRATKEQREAILLHRSPPLYYQPTYIQGGVYLDINATYLQLMDVIGWDPDYFPRKFLGAGRPPSDFPARHDKTARNTLVSCGLSSSVSVWTGSKLTETYPRNKHINYGLWSAIQDILHEIARCAVDFGATYVATDGYILPDGQAEEFQEYLEIEWKIKASVRNYGATVVTGLGSYQIGDYKTQRFHGCVDKPYSNVDPIHDDMLSITYRTIATNRIDKPYLTMLD